MDAACKTFRASWLATALEAAGSVERDAHLDGCEACQAWASGAHLQVAALGQLPRLQAPAELEARVFRAEPSAVAGESDLSDARDERWRQVLETLPRLEAPHVLERLVDEELASPETARARRFAGDLDRHQAPTALERRVFPLPSAPTRRGVLRVLPLAAAAALALWLTLRTPGSEASSERPFKVHHEVPAEVPSMVAGLVEGWHGGILPRGGVLQVPEDRR